MVTPLPQWLRLLSVSLGLFFVMGQAQAGVYEIGVSGSYKKSFITEKAYDESRSLTGSLSYYFDESSALEFSYTDGISKRMIGEGEANGQLTNMTYKMMGLDFILTFGSREAMIRPYVKIGGAYISEKKITSQTWLNYVVDIPRQVEDPASVVPSVGAGFKLVLNRQWSIKVGAEAWTSRPLSQKPITIDYAGRAGLSWLF